jgi:hypothetical protein
LNPIKITMKNCSLLLLIAFFSQGVFAQNIEVIDELSSHRNYDFSKNILDLEGNYSVLANRDSVKIFIKNSSENKWLIDTILVFQNGLDSKVSISENWLAVSVISIQVGDSVKSLKTHFYSRNSIGEWFFAKKTESFPADKYGGHTIELNMKDSSCYFSAGSSQIDSIQSVIHFKMDSEGDWYFASEFYPPGEEKQNFVTNIIVNKDWLFVSDYDDSIPNGNTPYYSGGTVFVYQKMQGELIFHKKITIPSHAGNFFNRFGYDLAVQADELIVGSPMTTGNSFRSGSVYVFNKDLGGENNWGLSQKISPEPQVGNAWIGFGYGLGISEKSLMIAAPDFSAKALYHYKKDGDIWKLEEKVIPTGVKGFMEIAYNGTDFLTADTDFLYQIGESAVLKGGDRGICDEDTLSLVMKFPRKAKSPFHVSYKINNDVFFRNNIVDGDTIQVVGTGEDYEIGFSSVTDNDGKELSISKSTKLSSVPVHNLNFTGDATVCEGQTAELSLRIPRPEGIEISQHFFSRFNVYGTVNDRDTTFYNVSPNHKFNISPSVGKTTYEINRIETSFGCVRESEFIKNRTIVQVKRSPTAVFSLLNDTICSGTPLTASSQSVNFNTLNWLLNGVSVGDQSELNYLATSLVSSDLKLVAELQGCFDTASMPVSVIFQPEVNLDADKFCLDDSAQFTFNGIVDSLTAFNWKLNGQIISKEKYPVHKFSASGDYQLFLEVNNQGKCFSSSEKSIVANPSPQSQFYVDNNCEFQLTNFRFDGISASPNNFFNWEIYNSTNQLIEASFNQSFTIGLDVGNYSANLVVKSDLGCSNAEIQHFMVYENSKPRISRENPFSKKLVAVTSSENVISYQWYRNNNELSDFYGGNNVEIEAYDSGWYKVAVLYEGECLNTSDSVYISLEVIASLEGYGLELITYYPNPSNDYLTINFHGNKDLKLSICDINGKAMQSYFMNSTTTFDISKLDNGIYFLRFSLRDSVLTRKWIKSD